ncbi:hypothetical protein HO173_005949 [Letharia columbiana]|uniref:Uncharacterized protein n=1 Tax=Letharia columbiana TaxID=112416 RepID=A0A8H6FVZ5_9LECA|nr:uncharacterized protein HO173_005949 [Letharia columbiana]KAF6235754.1 hypothetical protein HO173_005949 [Letharia columbiana]
MNTIVFGTPRPKVTQRLRHVHPFARLLEPLLTPLGHPSANPLLLAIEAASEPNTSSPIYSSQASDVKQEEDLQQANAENSTENIAEIVISSSDTTGLLSTVSHQSTQPVQEKSIQQANAENTTEKPSGNKAPSTKNTAQLSKIPRHMLSTIPYQIITQQAENTTAT